VRTEAQVELHFRVHDTGIGIPPERLGLLFQPFSQLDASTTRYYGGTGLGLAICRRLCELMGGSIQVESQLGAGSTFEFYIKAASAEGMPEQPVSLPAEMQGRRVLVVDDNSTTRLVLSHQLSKWNLAVRAADSCDEALTALQTGAPFDVAMLDVNLPGVDDFAVALEMRRIPWVALTTAGTLTGDHQQRFAAFLAKPLKPARLAEALSAAFSGNSVRKAEGTSGLDPNLARRIPLRILIAEDNLVNQKVAVRLLQRMGYRPEVAANGMDVLQELDRNDYDLVLMDVHMPEMDGLEATRRIRAQRPQGNGLRIVAMTASAFSDDRAECMAAGMDDYITKPVRIVELQSALERCAPGVTAKPA